MYSGLLGFTEADLSTDDEDAGEADDHHNVQAETEDREKLIDADGTNNDNNNSGPGSSHPPAVQEHESSLPGISQETWQKFKELQKRKNEIKETKDFRRRRRRRHKKAGTINKDSTEEREHQAEPEKHWDELKQYFGVNDRFQPPACSKPPPKSGLEKSIESAIAEGDIAKAEEMSDRLATRELGVKITQAADCRDYVEHKQEEEARRAAQKRKNQITWGFEAKRRWETKSNMGYM